MKSILPTRALFVVLGIVFGSALPAGQRSARPAQPPPARPSPQARPPQLAAPPPVTMAFPPLSPPPAGGLNTGFPFTPPSPALPAPTDLFRVRRGDRVFTRTHGRFPVGFAGGYLPGYDVSSEQMEPSASAAPEATGMLRLTGTPESGQVFVDGYYVGALADIEAQRGLTLRVGPHRIEIRATDYLPATFDVRLEPNAVIAYHAALEYARPAPPARTAAAAANARRMYLISSCYLGNVPPKPNRLPPGCDIKRVQVIP